jgi:hypothetical protein
MGCKVRDAYEIHNILTYNMYEQSYHTNIKVMFLNLTDLRF